MTLFPETGVSSGNNKGVNLLPHFFNFFLEPVETGASSHGGDGGKCLHFWAGGIFFRLGDVKISLRGGFFHDPGGDASMTQGGIDAPALKYSS